MRLYYFVHITGTDPGISGIPRVVKNLAREFVSIPGFELVPVSWSVERKAIVHTEQKLLDNFARHGGPALEASDLALKPIEPAVGEWLLFAEVPHLGAHDPAYPPALIDQALGFARSVGMRVGALLHDIMPLTSDLGSERRRAFADLVRRDAGGDEAEVQRLRFAVYAHALAMVDIVLPVSRTSGDLLADWLVRHGHKADALPPISPNLLPEEVWPNPRAIPHGAARGPMEFLTIGTVCTHKNQLAAMAAFQRLLDRRPDLDIRLNVVGTVAPDVAAPASQLARRSRGRIVLHGHLPDDRLEAMRDSSHATVFLSLAEGYGLPVAESLWRGKPCLCSNGGSIAEIAAGGGCLPVDPRNLDEIEKGFETLATNALRYDELLRQNAARSLRTWREYAVETADRLTACAQGRLESVSAPGLGVAAGDGESGPYSAMLTFSASDLSVPAVYVSDRERPIRYMGAIRFEREADGAIDEDVLFFGPRVWLPAGQYAFTFDGEITGEIDLALTAEGGVRKIARVSLTSFADPIVVDLPGPVDKFEIVGRRTPSLERLVLRGASADYRSAPQSSSAKPQTSRPLARAKAETPGAPVSPASSAAVGGRDDDGRPLSFPCAIPATGLRVHSAYDAGAGNLLRAESTIAFRMKDHGGVSEDNLFFGPYFHLEPGDYAIRLDGELKGRLRLRLTQNFASENLVETVLKSFEDPIRLKLTRAAEKFEIIGDRLSDTRSMTLRAIVIARESAPQVGKSRSPWAASQAPTREAAMERKGGFDR